jgi:hypothetical protein
MSLVEYSPGTDPQTVDSVLFTTLDKSDWVYQPNLVRWRHRSKGPRESLKINQEIGQTYFDLKVLMARLNIVNENLEFIVNQIQDGGEVEGTDFIADPDTPSEEPIVLLGLDVLGAEIESLRKRIEVLEG